MKLRPTILAAALSVVGLTSCAPAPPSPMCTLPDVASSSPLDATSGHLAAAAKFGRWADVLASVPVFEVTDDTVGLPSSSAWFQGGFVAGSASLRCGAIYLRPGDYPRGEYVTVHELAHALAWLKLSTTFDVKPDGWAWTVEQWADCVVVVLHVVEPEQLSTEGGYGCPSAAETAAADRLAPGLVP